MSSNLDRTLDQVIASSRKGGNKRRGARRSSAKAALLGSSPAKAPKTTTKPKAAETKSNSPPTAEKIIVSNLPPDVNEVQIKELFNSQVGPTKEVVLNYDAAGRSKGIAAVTFTRNGDGTKAYKQYNGRLIDGKQPMKVEIVVDPSKPPPLSQRVSAAPGKATKATKATPKVAKAATRAPKKSRALKKKGAGGAKRPAKSAEDLDAEMMDYAANGPAAATTA